MQGYALVEFAEKNQAEKAVKGTDNTTFLEKTIRTSVDHTSFSVFQAELTEMCRSDFAFAKASSGRRAGNGGAAPPRRGGRDREASPSRR